MFYKNTFLAKNLNVLKETNTFKNMLYGINAAEKVRLEISDI
jgi:hypothetical protein